MVRGLNREFGPFALDVCADASNAVCARWYSVEQNGLVQRWDAPCCWMNPPYGRQIGDWVSKAASSVREGVCQRVVCLLPARTDTRWWQIVRTQAALVRFLPGRVKFGNGQNGAPFPSAVVVFDVTTWPSLMPLGHHKAVLDA